MKTLKLVLGIISMVLFLVVVLQSCAAGVANTLEANGEISGTAGLFVALLMLAGGIVGVAGRKSRGGAIACVILYVLAAIMGFANAGSYADLNIWAALCLVLAVIFFISIFAQNYAKVETPVVQQPVMNYPVQQQPTPPQPNENQDTPQQ